MKLIMAVLVIGASLFSGGTKRLIIAAAQADETHESGGSGGGQGATCG